MHAPRMGLSTEANLGTDMMGLELTKVRDVRTNEGRGGTAHQVGVAQVEWRCECTRARAARGKKKQSAEFELGGIRLC